MLKKEQKSAEKCQKVQKSEKKNAKKSKKCWKVQKSEKMQ